MKYPLILFDLDGVIIDTEPAYTGFWSTIGHDYFPSHPEFAASIKGNSLTKILETHFKDKPLLADEVVQRLNDFQAKMRFPLVPGALEFVVHLRKSGYRTAIVTSSDREKMLHLYRSVPEFTSLFDRIFTAEDSCRSKPAPDCYLHAAEAMGCVAKDCAIFEDSPNGLLAARASGAKVYGVATGLPCESLQPLCDVVVERYDDDLLKVFC